MSAAKCNVAWWDLAKISNGHIFHQTHACARDIARPMSPLIFHELSAEKYFTLNSSGRLTAAAITIFFFRSFLLSTRKKYTYLRHKSYINLYL